MNEAFDVTSGTTESKDCTSQAVQQCESRSEEWDLEPDQSDTARQDITDAATGLSRLLAEKCATCIFRPGDLMFLGPSYLATLVREALQKGTYVVCHDTLTYSDHPDFGPAICRGFFDAYAHKSLALKILRSYSRLIEVDPPTGVMDSQ